MTERNIWDTIWGSTTPGTSTKHPLTGAAGTTKSYQDYLKRLFKNRIGAMPNYALPKSSSVVHPLTGATGIGVPSPVSSRTVGGTPDLTTRSVRAPDRSGIDWNNASPGVGSGLTLADQQQSGLDKIEAIKAANPSLFDRLRGSNNSQFPGFQGDLGSGRLSQLEQELRNLLSKPDIPGHWISPVSQSYLDQLGANFRQSGAEANQAYQGAIGDISRQYQQGNQGRIKATGDFVNERNAGLARLGINPAGTSENQGLRENTAALNQVSQQNLNTDIATNKKLGTLFDKIGQQMGTMAQEGLLHPKQYIGRQSGLSAGEEMLARTLAGQIGNLTGRIPTDWERYLADRDYALRVDAAEASREAANNTPEFNFDFGSAMDNSAEANQAHFNPLFAERLQELSPNYQAYAQDIYDRAGGDVQGALQLLAEEGIGNPANPFAGRFDNLGPLIGAGLNQKVDDEWNKRVQGRQDVEAALAAFFRGISPYYTGVTTDRRLKDSSNQTQDYGYGF